MRNAPAFAVLVMLLVSSWPQAGHADTRAGTEAVVRSPESGASLSASPVAGPSGGDPSYAPPGSATPEGPPSGLSDLPAWLEYQSRNHIAAIPEEARLIYRNGLLLHQSGVEDEAVRLVRGASILDPTYVAPHLTLAMWFLLRDPSQALLQYAAVLDLARENFVLQLALVANLLYLGLQAFFLGLLATAMLLVWAHQRELRHGWQERLGRWLSPWSAEAWSWGFLVLPYFAGLGLALPTTVFLGLLWPTLRASARALFLSLVLTLGVAPWVTCSLERLAAPLRADRGPYWGVPLIETRPYSSAGLETVTRLAREHPNNGFLQFGLGWMARRGGDLRVAEAGFRRALAVWPHDGRVMNDLGNALAMEGRVDEALDLYRRATEANPSNAAAWFNASQILTLRYDYRAASDALARASALNFDMVKAYQSKVTNDGALPLADQWLAPESFWARLSIVPPLNPGSPALPPAWRGGWESSGLPFSALVLVLAGLAITLGRWQHRAVPLRICSSCGDVVCRRCAERRRELALCPRCVAVEARAESPEFARVLLLQHRRAVRGRERLVRTALATLIPGYGILTFRRVFGPLVLLVWAAALAGGWLGTVAPFSYEPRLMLSDGEVPVLIQVGLWVFIYALSLGGYFVLAARARAHQASLEAPARSRATQSTHRAGAAAA